MKSILDPKFRYTPAAGTDIRKTFQRIKREHKQAQEEQQKKISPIVRKLLEAKR